MPGAYGSPKTHFSEQPCFLGTLDDHENERISFPALFCSKLNNESGILAAVCRTNCPHLLQSVITHLKVRPLTKKQT